MCFVLHVIYHVLTSTCGKWDVNQDMFVCIYVCNTNVNILCKVIIDRHTLALTRSSENGAPDDGCCRHSWVHHHRDYHQKGCHHHGHSHIVNWIAAVDVNNDVTLGKEKFWGFLIEPYCCIWLHCPEMSRWFLCIRRICIIAVITSLINHGFFYPFSSTELCNNGFDV